MHILNIILKVTDKAKPLLIKILPINLLRKLKRQMIFQSYQKVARVNSKPFVRMKYKDGVNLIGSIRAETGLGQSCRLIANQLNESKLDFMIYNYEPVTLFRMNDCTWDKYISNKILYNINLIHMNPYELGLAYVKLSRKTWRQKYNIAFWLWELEELPKEWLQCLPCIDEIWTPSQFVSNAMRKSTTKPVITIPYYVTATYEKKYDRDFFKLPKHKFLFLTMYDSNSTIERKNPLGAIEAYKKAFPIENGDTGFVIKINNVRQDDLDDIKEMLYGYENVYYITDVLKKNQVNSLIKCVNVFVSLHRAEGFGLVLAEAMLLGTPTIATNWSANTEFMTRENSCLVDYKLEKIRNVNGAYKEGYRWANPDLNQAGCFMIRLIEDREFYESIAMNAKEYIKEHLSKERAVKLIERRVGEIYKREKKV